MNYIAYIVKQFFLTSTVTNGIDDSSDAVVSISEAISEYGPLIVIMAVFIVVFILMAALILRNNAKMMNQIMNDKDAAETVNQQMIEKFVTAALENHGVNSTNDSIETLTLLKDIKSSLDELDDQKKKDEKSDSQSDSDDYHKDIVGAYIDVNMAFKDASRKTLSILDCQRVGIYVFHNGNNSMHGLPFFKMSCIHEWTNRGYNTLRGKSHTDMPLHLFNDFIEDLHNNGIYRSQDVSKSIENDPSLEEFIEFSHTKALYLVAIKDADGILVGFVIAEFENVDNFEDDPARDKFIRENLNAMVFNVSPFIANKYIYKRKQSQQENNG